MLNFHPIELLAQTEVELIFLKRLRDEKKFESVEALREQIGKDVERAGRFFRMLATATSTLAAGILQLATSCRYQRSQS